MKGPIVAVGPQQGEYAKLSFSQAADGSVTLDGEWAPRVMWTRQAIEQSPYVHMQGDNLEIDVAGAYAMYRIEDQSSDVILTRLLYAGPVNEAFLGATEPHPVQVLEATVVREGPTTKD